ncbi:uncharacterized protein LOC112053041 [Bicyclus anynana]|uniref:non-specific serine/threonine protein kinase n=1 Tax=Bicyclus anynana TaxID=110368 RepID=A0A6J1NSF8_BICAN|nr:uncharacterized protein LOC112053041 [Bicyclus anynana]
MKRTYRSKKETGGGLDPRDVVLALDEKASAFDAFYIQNIKQTKREMSIGASMFAASNKVRKRKYVKRLKDQEPIREARESTSTSAYLTPDKSLRLKRALDPFDMLLNSPSSKVSSQPVFSPMYAKRKGKSYRKKASNKKKYNYNTSESDSEKETHQSISDVTHDASNVLSYKLDIVEEKVMPAVINDSINDIKIEDLSLLKNTVSPLSMDLKDKFNTSFVKSPLCSTPFNKKYRGKSIYKFSPISLSIDDSEYGTTTTEFQKSCNNQEDDRIYKIVQNTTSIVSHENNVSDSPVLQTKDVINKTKLKDVETFKRYHHLLACKNISQLEKSTEEPLLGFSNAISSENIFMQAIRKRYKEITEDTHNDVQKSQPSSFSGDLGIVKNCHGSYSSNSNDDDSTTDNFKAKNNHHEINKSQNNINLEVSIDQYNEEKYNNENESIHKTTSHISLKENSMDPNKQVNTLGFSQIISGIGNEISINEHYLLEQSETYTDKNSVIENENSLVSSPHRKECDVYENQLNANEESTSELSHIYLEQNSNICSEKDSIVENSNCLTPQHLKESNTEENQLHLNEESISELSYIYSEQNSTISSEKNIIVEIDNSLASGPPLLMESYTEESQLHLNKESISELSHTYSERNSSINSDYSSKADSSTSGNSDSHYESCNSECEISEIKTNKKELVVELERLNESLISKYYTNKNDSINGALETENMKDALYCGEISSNSCSNDNERESTTSNEECDVSQESSNADKDVASIDENNKSDEDIFDSFVTRRKRNEVTKDSFILSFENSLTSGSSGDYDKTVISNYKNSLGSLKEYSNNTLTISDVQIDKNGKVDESQIESEYLLQKEKSILETNTQTETPLPKIKRSSEVLTSVGTRKSSKFLNRVSYDKEIDGTSRKSLAAGKRTVNTRKSKQQYISSPNILAIDEDNYLSSRNSVVPHTDVVTRRTSRLSRKSNENINSSAHRVPAQNFDNQTSYNIDDDKSELKPGIVLEPGKRWERSLSIFRRMTTLGGNLDQSVSEEEKISNKGRMYRQSVIHTMEIQDISVSLHNESVRSRFSDIHSKPSRSTIKIVRESNASRISLSSTLTSEDLGFLTEDCDDTVVELSKLSIIGSDHEVTVLDNFNDSSNRITTARDYVLRRCNQTDVILFDECYPDTALKNCRKIGEGVYGEVFLWRAGDGRARVLKIVPIAGDTKVNGESQKDYHEIISEIVIAMELSALRAPIIDIEKHFDEGQTNETLDLHCVENATDVFNEVLAVRCVYGNYPSRLLDLWELYDECKGSDNDNPAVLPPDQQFMVLELANAGQDLEGYQFHNAEQAYALFKQVAFGLAVAEEAFQFEHRDLHWGNVLIAPTEQKYATFVLRGRVHRVARRGVAATVIDYSLSRLSLRLPSAESAALYNDLSADDGLFDAVGDYQFSVYRLMRDKLGNDWKNFEPYTNILWLHYIVDKMITALRYTRTNTKIHKHYIAKLKEIKNRILDYGSAVQYVLTDNEL